MVDDLKSYPKNIMEPKFDYFKFNRCSIEVNLCILKIDISRCS